MWARIDSNKVVELTDVDPQGRFHESLVWVACEANVKEGWTYLKNKFTPPVENKDELMQIARILRDSDLNSTQWLLDRNRDESEIGVSNTLSSEQITALLSYRQLLRDWPASEGFPNIGTLPAKPSWLV